MLPHRLDQMPRRMEGSVRERSPEKAAPMKEVQSSAVTLYPLFIAFRPLLWYHRIDNPDLRDGDWEAVCEQPQ